MILDIGHVANIERRNIREDNGKTGGTSSAFAARAQEGVGRKRTRENEEK